MLDIITYCHHGETDVSLQENGVATAIESIYRDLEYARSLVKRRHDDEQERATIRDKHHRSASASASLDHSAHSDLYTDESSNGSSVAGAPSEDWSVISATEDTHSPRD